MDKSRTAKIAYANALIEKLWSKGLLTDEQKKKIIDKVAEKIN